jgi:hypothetical protein
LWLRECKITAEATLSSVHKSARHATLSVHDVVRNDKSLMTIERACGSNQSLDWKVRPIFHRREYRGVSTDAAGLLP